MEVRILKMYIYSILMFIFLLFAAKANGQEIQYKLIDAGLLTHNIHGKGIELRIQPSALPKEGLAGIKQDTLANVCRFYASKVIPIVKKKTGFTEAQFIGVRVVSGNSSVGQYVLQVYALENDTCGAELN